MKRITFRADSALIDAARDRARADHTTLSELFRSWLAGYTRRRQAGEAMAVIDRIRSYASTGGRKFTRDEMNER